MCAEGVSLGESWRSWSKIGDYERKFVFMGGIWRIILLMRRTWRFYAEVAAYGCDLALLEDVGPYDGRKFVSLGRNRRLWLEAA